MKYRLPKTEEKPQYIEEKFDKIAQKYDLFNDIITLGIHRYWKKILVKKTKLNKDKQCLDLCCGTGDISRELLNQYPNCKVIGLDFSEKMLCIAKSKFVKNSNIRFLKGDAMHIPFSDGIFDAVTIGYGLRNVSNIKNCLKEIFRVLKPGGVLACLDLGKVRVPVISILSKFYFFRIVPLIGNLLIPEEEMFHYLPHSSIKYPSQELIESFILEVGFKRTEMLNFFFGASIIHIAYKTSNNDY